MSHAQYSMVQSFPTLKVQVVIKCMRAYVVSFGEMSGRLVVVRIIAHLDSSLQRLIASALGLTRIVPAV